MRVVYLDLVSPWTPGHCQRGFLLLPSPHIIEYSDDVLIVFSPQHILYHPPVSAPFPDNSITIAAVVIVWAVLFM